MAWIKTQSDTCKAIMIPEKRFCIEATTICVSLKYPLSTDNPFASAKAAEDIVPSLRQNIDAISGG